MLIWFVHCGLRLTIRAHHYFVLFPSNASILLSYANTLVHSIFVWIILFCNFFSSPLHYLLLLAIICSHSFELAGDFWIQIFIPFLYVFRLSA